MPILIHKHSSIRWLLCAIAFGASLRVVAADALTAPEYKIKAAFLYNFAVLTEWPTNAFVSEKAPLTIGVLGKDPFGRVLEETMKGKTIAGRTIAIARYKRMEEIDHCHLVFISLSEEKNVEAINAAFAKCPILTVSEINRFNFKGGMIWLQNVQDKIKFRIRYGAARESGLKLSSKLLALATNSAPKKKKEAK